MTFPFSNRRAQSRFPQLLLITGTIIAWVAGANAGDISPTAPFPGMQGEPAQSAPSATVVFKRAGIRDPWINNKIACTVLVPQGWDFQGEMVWNPDNSVLPVTVRTIVAKPNSPEAVYCYPRLTFVDGMRESAMRIGGPWLASRYPEGSSYLGNEVRRQVASPADYVRDFILPRFRPDLRGARIVQVWDMAEYARARAQLYSDAPGLRMTSQRVRIVASVNGRDAEEDFLCTIGSAPILQTIGWSGECESYRAARGELDSRMPLYRTIGGSLSVNLDWFGDVCYVGELIKQRQLNAVRNAAALSRYLAENQRQISDTIRRSYEDRCRIIDRCNDRFDQHIRGVQRYVDPFDSTRTFEAPNAYGHVFVNATGDVIATNNHLFNPNQAYNGDWREVKPVR